MILEEKTKNLKETLIDKVVRALTLLKIQNFEVKSRKFEKTKRKVKYLQYKNNISHAIVLVETLYYWFTTIQSWSLQQYTYSKF